MKDYEKPQIEITKFQIEDIITTSLPDYDEGNL